MNAAFLAVSLSVAFTACDPETEVTTGVVTFEDVVLDTTGFYNGKDGSFHFESGIMTFPIVYIESGAWSWWTGIACSSLTDMEAVGYANQYSVYAPSGAAGSKNFGLVGSDGAVCSFEKPVKIKSMMINNSTYDYWALKDGNDGNGEYGMVRKFVSGDYFNVTVIGYDSLNVKIDSVVVPLAEFRNAQSYICSEWTKVTFEQLGDQVKAIGFKFDSSDKTGIWLNTPQYVCIDNIVYETK